MCGRLHRGEVEAPDVPVVIEMPVSVRGVLDDRRVHLGPVREHQATGPQPAVARPEDLSEPGLVHEEVAHPLRHDDVNLLDASWQPVERAGLATHELNGLRPITVVPRHLRRHRDKLALRFHGDDLRRARLCGEERANTQACASVQDHGTTKQVRVLLYGFHICRRRRRVLQDILMHAVVVVGVEVVVGRRSREGELRPMLPEGLLLWR
mmetsp:Transcript_3418/g.8600  ORF Transcript_3418/g.8600 Transcript_3418/m.8600 type:complete len:209 (+) Transcript_3418:389-1015(+)